MKALRRRQQKEKDNVQRAKFKIEFKRQLASYKKSIIETKRKSFKLYMDSIMVKDTFGTYYKVIKQRKGRPQMIENIQRPDGSLIDNRQAALSAIITHHFPKGDTTSIEIDSEQEHYENFTSTEIEYIIHSMPDGKAPGLDQIPTSVIRKLFEIHPEWFAEVMNKCLAKGKFPEIRKQEKLALIPKEGKNPKDPSAYRPICLLPIWRTVLDKTITKRLTFFIEQNNILSNLQFGFRKNDSTMDAINKIVEEVNEDKAKRSPTCLIALDISNAFNTVNWEILIGKLQKYKIPGYLLQMVASFLNNRKITIYEITDSDGTGQAWALYCGTYT